MNLFFCFFRRRKADERSTRAAFCASGIYSFSNFISSLSSFNIFINSLTYEPLSFHKNFALELIQAALAGELTARIRGTASRASPPVRTDTICGTWFVSVLCVSLCVCRYVCARLCVSFLQLATRFWHCASMSRRCRDVHRPRAARWLSWTSHRLRRRQVRRQRRHQQRRQRQRRQQRRHLTCCRVSIQRFVFWKTISKKKVIFVFA